MQKNGLTQYLAKMDLHKLEQANNLAKQIEDCKECVRKAQWIVSDDVKPRQSFLKAHGLDSDLPISQDLFKAIGALILSTEKTRLNKLEEQFNSL